MNHALEMVKLAYEGLEDKKAENIKIIDISNLSVIADYFVIAHATNSNQMGALVRSVDEKMHKAGYALKQQEGNNYSSWILLDYADIIVHIFTEEDRSFYGLEKLWSDGIEVDITKL